MSRAFTSAHTTDQCPKLTQAAIVAHARTAQTGPDSQVTVPGDLRDANGLFKRGDEYTPGTICYTCQAPFGPLVHPPHPRPKSGKPVDTSAAGFECAQFHSGGHITKFVAIAFFLHREALLRLLPERAKYETSNPNAFKSWCLKPCPDTSGWANLHVAFDAAGVVYGLLPERDE